METGSTPRRYEPRRKSHFSGGYLTDRRASAGARLDDVHKLDRQGEDEHCRSQPCEGGRPAPPVFFASDPC